LLAVAGCGGAGTLSRDEAMKAALDAAADQAGDPSSDLYGHRLQLESATPTGHANWLVRLADRTSGRAICVAVATTRGAVVASANVEFIPCASRPVRTSTAPAPSV